jgi:hypothetical protein
LDSFFNEAFAYRFNKTGANAKDVKETTNFIDIPQYRSDISGRAGRLNFKFNRFFQNRFSNRFEY